LSTRWTGRFAGVGIAPCSDSAPAGAAEIESIQVKAPSHPGGYACRPGRAPRGRRLSICVPSNPQDTR